jgi:hypothetical protein
MERTIKNVCNLHQNGLSELDDDNELVLLAVKLAVLSVGTCLGT